MVRGDLRECEVFYEQINAMDSSGNPSSFVMQSEKLQQQSSS
jgi:hypothetical protein